MTKMPYHKIVANQIIEGLKAGTAPWLKPLNLLHILPKRKKHDQIHLLGGDGWNLRLKMQRPGLKRFLVQLI